MARGVRLSLTVAAPASDMIDRLLETGLYGFNRAEVAQRLLYASLREEMRTGILEAAARKAARRKAAK